MSSTARSLRPRPAHLRVLDDFPFRVVLSDPELNRRRHRPEDYVDVELKRLSRPETVIAVPRGSAVEVSETGFCFTHEAMEFWTIDQARSSGFEFFYRHVVTVRCAR